MTRPQQQALDAEYLREWARWIDAAPLARDPQGEYLRFNRGHAQHVLGELRTISTRMMRQAKQAEALEHCARVFGELERDAAVQGSLKAAGRARGLVRYCRAAIGRNEDEESSNSNQRNEARTEAAGL